MTTALLHLVRISEPLEISILGRTLSRLDVSIFPTVQVEEFKAAFQRRTVRSLIITGFMQTAFTLALSILAFWGAAMLMPSGFSGVVGMLFLALSGLSLVALAPLPMLMALQQSKEMHWELEWSKSGNFKQKVPKFSQKIIRKIRAQLPGAKFAVESFDTDPFLWVVYGKKRYCIDHWDETFIDR